MNTTSPTTTPQAFFTQIEDRYFVPSTGYYREELGKSDVAFNWTLGILISAQNALAQSDPSYIPKLKSTLAMAESYWNDLGPTAGFDVLPSHPGDRYYDDNAWMVMALVESFEITQDEQWLDRAEAALAYVLSGEDTKLGGGIYWRERDKASKNTCSNGPAAAACLGMSHHRRRDEYIEVARRLYRWTKDTLWDPMDGCFFDNIDLKGAIEGTKWSYNTALMIRSAREVARATGQSAYDRDAETFIRSAQRRWIMPDGSIDDEMPFAHLLFENLNGIEPECIAYLRANIARHGACPPRWADGEASPKLIVQASALRALAGSAARLT